MPRKQGKKPGSKEAATIRAVRLDLTINCMRCMRPIPINAVGAELRCRACLHVMTFDVARWESVAARSAADALQGKTDWWINHADDTEILSRSRIAEPTCPACEATLDVGALAAGSGDHTCRYGTIVAVRDPDALVRAIHVKTVRIVGERAPAPVEAVEPVVFRCSRCGKGLATDGTSRAIRCDGCVADVDVPEALWDELHAVRRRAPLTLLIGGAR